MPDCPALEEAAQATRELTSALTALSDALARGNLDGVLAAEPALTTALASMKIARGRLMRVPPTREQAVGLVRELDASRAALQRCAALGASLDDFVRGRGLHGATYTASGSCEGHVTPGLEHRV